MINKILSKFKIIILYRFGAAIGEHVCMTAVVNSEPARFIIFTSFPEFFKGNPKCLIVIGIKNSFLVTLLTQIFSSINGPCIWHFRYAPQFGLSLEDYMIKTKSNISLIELNSLSFKRHLTSGLAEPSIPVIENTRNEDLRGEKKLIGIICPEAKISYTPNKAWEFERFQEVVERMPEITWIQCGLSSDRPLAGCLDFRGKTDNLLDLVEIISNASFVLCTEGLYNHLAAAVKTKCYCIFSGFHPSAIATYSTTYPIVNKNNIECAPCWRKDPCPIDRRCILEVSVDQVVSSIRQDLNNLPVDEVSYVQ